MEKVAVVVDETGKCSTFFDGSFVEIYDKTEDGWKCNKIIKLHLTPSIGMQAIRKRVAEIIQQMGSCKMIAGSAVTGLPYNLLDAAGISIFELEGLPASFLDAIPLIINEDIKQRQADEKAYQSLITPKPTEVSGRYQINLIDIQRDHSQISSKQILIPIFKEQAFDELEVTCGHVPPWFDRELGNYGLEQVTEQACDHIYKVTVRHKASSKKKECESKCR